MADDYFPMAGPADAAEADKPPQSTENAPPKEEGQEEGNTALIPKSVLGGKDFKVGEEVVLKIVRFHDDEVEVEYAPEKPGGGEAGPTANDEIDQMANPGGGY